MKDILKMFSIFTPKQLRECYFLFFVMLIGAVLESVGIGAILPLISLMGQTDWLDRHQELAVIGQRFGVDTHEKLIIAGAIALIGLYVLKNAYIAVEIYLQRSFAKKNQIIYSRELLATYLAKPYIFHVNNNTATLLRNVNAGALVVFNSLLMPVFSLLTELVTALAIWLMLVTVDSFTAIVVAGIMGLMIYAIIRIFRRQVIKQGKLQNEAAAEYIKWINQGLGAVKETKVLRREKFFLEEFNKGYTKYASAVQKYSFLNEMPRIIIETLVVTGLLALIIYKLLNGEKPQDIVPVLGVLALAAFRLMPSANRIVGYYNAIKNQMPFFNEIYPDLMNIKNNLLREDRPVRAENETGLAFRHRLIVDDLVFSYPENQEDILQGVSFEIPKGKFVGIVGPSGAGKTTFVDIMLGLLEPSGGRILCDGVDINKNIRAWQANLAYVPQDIYLIDGTIKENIALGLKYEDIDDNMIDKVLHMAELYDFVYSLPKGAATFVGERGVKLSGGQRQRIGIARALYQCPEVLILDEATSALDNETEKSITDTILKLKGQITIIAIAHRVSTLEQCDFKIKFENGKATRAN